MNRARVAASVLLSAGLATVLGAAVLARTVPSENLATRVAVALPTSGVEHSITAVLLQFRSYDTLLEIAVLLVAAVIALALRGTGTEPTSESGGSLLHGVIDTPVLRALIRLLLPAMVLTAVYLLWVGAYQPGGAFQAGAVLAALGVLWRVANERFAVPALNKWRHAALLCGFAFFLTAATGMLLLDRPLLAWPTAYAGTVIVAIETLLTVSIGVSLLGLFASAPDPTEHTP